MNVLNDSTPRLLNAPVQVTTRLIFDYLSNQEQAAVLTAALNAGDNLQSIIVTMYETYTHIEFVDFDCDNCGVDYYRMLGGNDTCKLVLMQIANRITPMTRTYFIETLVMTEKFQTALDVYVLEYKSKQCTRLIAVKGLIRIAARLAPLHLRTELKDSKVLRREVNQKFKLYA